MQALFLVLLVLIVPTHTAYSDSFARTKMLAMSGAAYSEPSACVANALSNGQVNLIILTFYRQRIWI